MIRKGQAVHIRPEWRDAGDEEFVWIAAEDEDGGRVRVIPDMPEFRFSPSTVVEVRMLIEGDATRS